SREAPWGRRNRVPPRAPRLRLTLADEDAAGEARVEGVELQEQVPGRAEEYLDRRRGADTARDEDISAAVPVGVHRPDIRPGEHRRVEREEALSQAAGPAIEHPDVRRSAVAGPSDDVVEPVAVDVPGRHPDPAPQRVGVGEEA